MKKYIIIAFTILPLLWSCGGIEVENKVKDKVDKVEEKKELTLYTHRHYEADQVIFKSFEEKTGIKVNVVNAKADELMQKMESEGTQSPADLLITVDAGRLVRAKAKGLLQPITSSYIEATVPDNLRDPDNMWFGVTKRARVIVYNHKKVKAEDLSTYEELTNSKWKGQLLIRSSSNIYNQSLLASIIANNGEETAKKWAAAMKQNFARSPKGNDRDQVKAIFADEGTIALINTYYLGKLLNSKDPDEVNAGKSVQVFFPNQEDRGTHVNVSGIGVAKHAPNKENAIKFIEYLLSKDIQETFASANYEYPVNPKANPSKLLSSWGSFKEDPLALSKLGELNKKAVITFDEVGWK